MSAAPTKEPFVNRNGYQLTHPNSPEGTSPPLDEATLTLFHQLMERVAQSGRPELVQELRRLTGQPSATAEVAPTLPSLPATTQPPSSPASAPAIPNPKAAAALASEGLRLLGVNKFPRAMEKFREAIALDPDNHDAHGNMGISLISMGNRADAEGYFQQALRLRPTNGPMYVNLGLAQFEQRKLDDAEKTLRQGVEQAPKHAETHHLLAVVLEAKKQDAEAEASFKTALSLNPEKVEWQVRLGKLYTRTNRHAEAEACYAEATKLQPDRASHWIDLGAARGARNRARPAEQAFRVAVSLEPNNAENHNNLGVSLGAQNRWAEAEECFRKALELNSQLISAYNNRGNNLRSLQRLEEAETCLREAVRLQPKYAEAHNNLGIVLVQQGRVADGLASYEEALRLRSDYPEARLNRSFLLLAKADFPHAWTEYEWRFKLRGRAVKPVAAEWDGSPLDGRTLLLRAEQGLGDSAQFMRYGALIPRGTGGTVIFECPEPLLDIAKTCKGIDRVVPRGQPLPACDLAIPLLSVPRVLKTTMETIPADVPYINADPARVEHWRRELAPLPGVRIGISWQGSREHQGDRIRSVPLARFAALGKVRGVTLCSIQKNFGSEQLLDDAFANVTIHDFGAKTTASFADTAALVQALDLVVSIDTAVVHVAGAFAVPVWVLLPAAADWRWLVDREDSPWYPTMRLFRQPKPGDWDTVFTQIEKALQQWPERLRKMKALV